MRKMELLLFSLKKSSVLSVEAKDGVLDNFVYDLFTKFDHEIEENNHSIILNEIQENSSKLRKSIDDLVVKYSQQMPQINQLKSFIKLLDENEIFYTILLTRDLSQEEVFSLGANLMSLNIKDFDLEKHMRESNDLFKPIWDNYTLIGTKDSKKYRIGEPNKKKRICRFCGKSIATGATFKNEAHAISEALGNKTIIFNEECDDCNSYFDQNIERDLITYLDIFRTFFGIMNKSKKVPTIKGKNFEYKNLGDRNLELRFFLDEENLDDDKPPNNIPLIFNETLTSQKIYKTLVKYALSIIENIDDNKFEKTIEWIRTNKYKDQLPKVGILSSYAFFKEHPSMVVYIRKIDDKNLPYAVGEFHFTFQTFVFIIPTFEENEPLFVSEEEYQYFWDTFRHFAMSKDFKYEDFSDNTDRNVQFNLSFEQRDISKTS